jgi:replicative DNA helicase
MTGLIRDSRQQEVTQISRELKALAKDFNVPFVVLCQLNRAVENRESHQPRLSDLRESGSLEQDAHKVLLLHRPSYYDMKKDVDAPDSGEAEIIIAKNRSGPIGKVTVCWLSDWMSFSDVNWKDF